MSAHVPSKTHIDLMVRAAIRGGRPSDPFRWWRTDDEGKYAGWYELDELHAEERVGNEHVTYFSPSMLGQQLVDEVVRSVSWRYPDDRPDQGELPGPLDAYYMGPYVYENPKYTLTPRQVFFAIDYFAYQACESDDWERTDAFQFCTSLRKAYCDKVPGPEGPWGWEAG